MIYIRSSYLWNIYFQKHYNLKKYMKYIHLLFSCQIVSFFVPHTWQEMISKSFQNIPVVQCCNFSFTIQLIIMYLYIYTHEATGNGWWGGGGGWLLNTGSTEYGYLRNNNNCCLSHNWPCMYKNSLKIVLTLISDNFKNGLSFWKMIPSFVWVVLL